MNIAIYGSGGAGKEVFDLLQETPEERAKWDEIVFIDDTVPSGEYWNCRQFTFENFRKTFTPEEIRIVIAVGEPKFREDLYNRVKEAGYSLTPPILHRLAFASDTAVLGEGVVLQDGVRVSPETELGANTFVNHRSMIGHNCVIGKHCQISANVMIAGCVNIGDTVFAGVSSESEGMRMVRGCIAHLKSVHKPYLIPGFILNCGARFLGFRLGKKYKLIPKGIRRLISSQPLYWA